MCSKVEYQDQSSSGSGVGSNGGISTYDTVDVSYISTSGHWSSIT